MDNAIGGIFWFIVIIIVGILAIGGSGLSIVMAFVTLQWGWVLAALIFTFFAGGLIVPWIFLSRISR